MTDHPRLMLPFEDGAFDLPDTGQIVILRAHGTYPFLPKSRITCVQGFWPVHQSLHRAGYATQTTLPETAAMAIVHVTRAKDETRALLAAAFDMLEPNGVLLVDGSKTDGIESLLKDAKKRGAVAGQVSKAHGKTFWCIKTDASNPFADWHGLLTPTKNADGFVTAGGVFSADGIDPGSAELDPHITGQLKGKGVDLGAGWGWLSARALTTCPEITDLDLIEAEHAALECARVNVTDPRANFIWADATVPDAKNTHDFVISNPPFHTGRKADPSLGRAFITTAATLLKPSGQLFLVANRQLAYEATLDTCFARWDVLSQSNRYKVVRARKPKL